MMDWTDRHCRVFHRALSRRARLYTEMVSTEALLHGDLRRLLEFDAFERPLALQLGGAEPRELARCAKLGERWGYDEINLNCGCPSERVQRGAFGACLMAEPARVSEGWRAMREAVSIPVTVKHRIGIDRDDGYGLVRDFVGQLVEAGCRVFIVHARNAWLRGLSPKENREVPPLRYERVAQLKHDFPEAAFVLNGGLQTLVQARIELERCDGVMLGRAAYHDPYLLAEVDASLFGDAGPPPTREQVVDSMSEHLARLLARGTHPRALLRHLLGLYHGRRGGRHWRRLLSDPAFVAREGSNVLRAARAAVDPAQALAA